MLTFNIYNEELFDGERDSFIERITAEVVKAYSFDDAFKV